MKLQLIHFALCFAHHPRFIQKPEPFTKRTCVANLATKEKIGCDVQSGSNSQVLVDCLDSTAPRIHRTFKNDRLPVEEHLTGIGNDSAAQNLDQRTLSRSVIADDCENFACPQFEIGPVQ